MNRRLKIIPFWLVALSVSAWAQLGTLPYSGGPSSGYTQFGADRSANVALSGSNLTVTYNSATTAAAARANDYKSSGLFYFEFTVNNTLTGGDAGGGVSTSVPSLINVASSATFSTIVYRTGAIWANDSNSTLTIGSIATTATIVGVAIDLNNRKAWFRIAPSGNWNGQAIGSQDPASTIGGVTITTGSLTPSATFGGTGGTNVPNNFTFNFGGSAFSGAVPSGFTSGWPI